MLGDNMQELSKASGKARVLVHVPFLLGDRAAGVSLPPCTLELIRMGLEITLIII